MKPRDFTCPTCGAATGACCSIPMVAITRLSARGEVRARVSTVFLSIAQGWTADGTPILWETAIFTSATDQDPERASDVEIAGRYTSRAAALAGHRRVVAALEAASDEKLDRAEDVGVTEVTTP
jgi:hypothetical protein